MPPQTRKNPKPRIGQGYKPFVPSKKFLKQYPKYYEQQAKREKKRRKQLIQGTLPKRYYQSPSALQRLKEDLLAKARYEVEQVRKRRPKNLRYRVPPEAELPDKIAILSSLLGGVEDAGDLLDIDDDLLLNEIWGVPMLRQQRSLVKERYSHLDNDIEQQELYNIDLDKVERSAAILSETLRSMEDFEMANILRRAVAGGFVNLPLFEETSGLFGGVFTQNQAITILEEWERQWEVFDKHGTPIKLNLNDMFEAFIADGYDIEFTDDSMFWAWFRENFYPDE